MRHSLKNARVLLVCAVVVSVRLELSRSCGRSVVPPLHGGSKTVNHEETFGVVAKSDPVCATVQTTVGIVAHPLSRVRVWQCNVLCSSAAHTPLF